MPIVDFHNDGDLKKEMPIVDEDTAIAQAVVRLLQTRRGSLWWNKKLGRDLRQYLNNSIDDPSFIAAAAAAEARKVTGIEAASASGSTEGEAVNVVLRIKKDNGGQIDLTLAINTVTVELISIQK